ncbi:3D domain-containing protein [Succiniclasticum ruminis]|uniref:3D (Asp-Asp-Asp) domain-containing protein n=1 Tax=Succiniclasticum ruminis DSM 9236 TaxID=1123323 RepID=A0A1I2EE83_9FIRM|nr:3D domain-containing protein [Succiniclasticum ruminis]SFE90886.1 3D (Asp-Asp-Asp) domain-containing protein [Succiniclasticum ruminis DSM 9236]
MNKKKEIKNRTMLKLVQGLTGAVFAVSAFMLPVTGFAEEAAATPKYVMPREQVYLDPSQVEAAKKQLEADAFYNANPQNNAPVAAAEKKEAAEENAAGIKEEKPAETVKPAEETKAVVKTEAVTNETAVTPEKAVKEEIKAEKPAVPEAVSQDLQVKKETAQQQVNTVAAEQKQAVPAPQKYVMPQQQVYLDPSQTEAAKQQLAADAFYNDRPQAKNVEIVTGDRVIADVKVIEKDETEKNVTAPPVENPAEKPVTPAVKDVKEEQPVTVQPKETEKDKTETPETAKENAAKPETVAGVTATDNTTGDTTGNKTEVSQPQEASRQKPVRLHHFGLAKEFTTHQATVAGVLEDAKINMDGRTVYPPPETEITDGMVIHVLARKSFLSREEVEVPFGTQFIDDPELAFGDKKVEKEGVKGKDLVIFENITRAGHEQKIELDRKRVTEPVNAVVRQGVAQSILTPNGYVKYKKVLYGEATAYTWGGGASGHTSVGLYPKRGIVAVDPRIIPYYTKMYIPGYGMAIAGDTGGAIVGTRIDLFMDSLHECYQWGRRDVEIYILE